MKIILLKLTLIFVLIISNISIYSQGKMGYIEDDTIFDPKPTPKDIDEETKSKIFYPEPYPNIIKELSELTLINYFPGEFIHSDILNFCNLIITSIENAEIDDKRIIEISIIGYADGLINTGIDADSSKIHNDCLKYMSYSTGQEDIALATLRSCQIEGILMELLKSKAYYLNINTIKDYYDEPNGGNIGGKYRKVVIKIKYIQK